MKINNCSTRRRLAMAMAITLLASFAALGQDFRKLAQAQQENARELRHYSWKSRTEIRKDGEIKSIQLSLMRYDIDGNLQKTPISATSQNLPTKGLRGLIARKKKESLTEKLDGLAALAKAYGALAPDKMQRFLANASVTPEITAQHNLIRIEGRDVLQPGDSMTIWIDAVTRKQRRVEIQTAFEREPVRIVSEFQSLSNGLTYMAHSVVDYRSEGLTLITDNTDYTRGQNHS